MLVRLLAFLSDIWNFKAGPRFHKGCKNLRSKVKILQKVSFFDNTPA